MPEGNQRIVQVARTDPHRGGHLTAVRQHLRRGEGERLRISRGAGGQFDQAEGGIMITPRIFKGIELPAVPAETGAQGGGNRELCRGGLRGVEGHGDGTGLEQAEKDFQPADAICHGEDHGASPQWRRVRRVEAEPRRRALIQFAKRDRRAIRRLHHGPVVTTPAQRKFPGLPYW